MENKIIRVRGCLNFICYFVFLQQKFVRFIMFWTKVHDISGFYQLPRP